jgi:hypothetical protein
MSLLDQLLGRDPTQGVDTTTQNPYPNQYPQQNNGQYTQPYPSYYGNPTIQDVLLKSLYPGQNGGVMNGSDWLKLGIGTLGNLWQKKQENDNSVPF